MLKLLLDTLGLKLYDSGASCAIGPYPNIYPFFYFLVNAVWGVGGKCPLFPISSKYMGYRYNHFILERISRESLDCTAVLPLHDRAWSGVHQFRSASYPISLPF